MFLYAFPGAGFSAPELGIILEQVLSKTFTQRSQRYLDGANLGQIDWFIAIV